MNSYNIPGVKTFEYTKIIGLENIEFGRDVLIDDFVFIYARKRMRIGNHVHIACFTSITGGEEFSLGDFSAVSQGCRILTGSDDFRDWGFGNSTIGEKYRNTKRAPIRIGKFAIVGANSVICPGVVIGEGVTVAACSVVTKTLEPWGLYAGNKRIKERNREGVLKNYDRYLEENK
ncbi:MAG: acetyltransferase [Planctomycetes bacterium RBG_13_60_9]|nr:MAG: acetyltransferase [Planctomycetes bacterium RBG_13_60_9]